jgi:hypothetical protein
MVTLLALVLIGPLIVAASGAVSLNRDWRSANRASAGIAPTPPETPEALLQVYCARAFNWRGLLAVHTWIATKAETAGAYRVHQVVGWNLWWDRPVVESEPDLPDRYWYDAEPKIIHEIRGARAAALIPRIEAAVAAYPYPREYRLWPGPNSNTFTAFVARAVPELGLELPSTAIGKDYLPGGALLGPAPSGTGYQISLAGALGVTAARREGLELNFFGLVFGIDPLGVGIKLPGIGRIGLPRGLP